MRLIITITLLLAAIGCSERPTTNAQLFARSHPVEAEKYKVLAITSPEFINYEETEQHERMASVIKTLERYRNDPAKLDKYIDALKRLQNNLGLSDTPSWCALTNRLRKGDSLYYFEYKAPIRNGAYSDFGYLVLRDGVMVYRSPIGWGFIDTEGETNHPPREMETDKL